MNKMERMKYICDLMVKTGKAAVTTLSRDLDVSQATIRADLAELERIGFLTRYHGGAAINRPEENLGPIGTYSDVETSPEMKEVGLIAAQLVQNHDSIFLGPGRTSCYIAHAFCRRAGLTINVVTNNFMVVDALRTCPNIRLHFIGGLTEPGRLFTVPENISNSLADIYLDKFFFSIDGVDLSAGYTLSDSSVHDMILSVARRSQKTVMVAEAQKFGRRSFMKIGGLDFAPIVVTNPTISEEYETYYANHGIHLYTSAEGLSNAEPTVPKANLHAGPSVEARIPASWTPAMAAAE